MAKTLERIVSEQIKQYLDVNELLDPHQSTYRSGHSTQTCLIRTLNEIRGAADDRKITVSVFFDFSKAFDCVRHDILLEKLKHKGFSRNVLLWLKSYLTGRKMAVKDPINNIHSEFIDINVGVPQGSVLGPLLFALYIDDFGKVPKYCKYNFYAGDLQMYLHCNMKELNESIALMNKDIVDLKLWAVSNFLKLNAKKTQAIIIGTNRYINSINYNNLPNIMCGGSLIPYSTNIKYLGVILSNTLSWDRHVTAVSNRVRRILYQLKLCRQLLPESLKRNLILALVYPHLDYCCTVLTDITAMTNLRLQRVMNACVRFIFNIRREHITPGFKRLRWLKNDTRRSYFVLSTLYIILQNGQPGTLYTQFTFIS